MTMLCFNKQLLYDSRFLMFQILSCKMNEFGLNKNLMTQRYIEQVLIAAMKIEVQTVL
jgi:hypothetical protein